MPQRRPPAPGDRGAVCSAFIAQTRPHQSLSMKSQDERFETDLDNTFPLKVPAQLQSPGPLCPKGVRSFD